MRKINDIFDQGQEAKARVGELYELVQGEANENANLSDLDTSSKTSIWSLWIYVFAALSWILEGVFNAFKTETQQIIDVSINGNDRWLAAEVSKFQFGDPLEFNPITYKYFYNILDPIKQIVKRTAVVSGAGLTTIKVAKEVDGSAAPLTSDELLSLQAYVSRIQFSGSNLDVVSYASDKLKLPVNVYYNALYPIATVRENIEAAILNYLANLSFNGTVYLSKIADAVQVVSGVVDVTINGAEGRYDSGEFAPVARVYNPLSGYVVIDDEFPLSSTINYIPSNG